MILGVRESGRGFTMLPLFLHQSFSSQDATAIVLRVVFFLIQVEAIHLDVYSVVVNELYGHLKKQDHTCKWKLRQRFLERFVMLN